MLITDKIDFKLDLKTGKLDLTGGRLNTSSGVEGVAQAAQIAVRQIKGEGYFDQSQGVAYIAYPNVVDKTEALLGNKFNAIKMETAIRAVLQKVPGVTDVLLLVVTEDSRTRKATSKWQLRTTFGDTPITAVVH